MTTYGIKFTNGSVVQIKASNMDRAKFMAHRDHVGLTIESVYPIGQYWDENGNQLTTVTHNHSAGSWACPICE